MVWVPAFFGLKTYDLDRTHTHYYLRREKPAVTTTLTAYVVCCNDSVKAVVPYTCTKEQADVIKKRLAREHFDRHPHIKRDYKAYRSIYYWHLHGAPVVAP